MRYGVGYKGSKSRIAKEIIDILPSGNRFIDLFGGGGAMSHCAALSGKYKQVIYSDVDSSITELVKNLFNGVYYNRIDLFEWVSRDRFYAEKETNPIVKWCWSFSNNGKDYLYSLDKEPQKEAIHKAIVNKEYSQLFLQITSGVIPFKADSIPDRKKEWYSFCRQILKSGDKNRLQCIERRLHLTQVEALTRVQAQTQVEALTRSYTEYEYQPGDVVYCDIPYNSTNCGSYQGFNHSEFWNWAEKIPCYISEYSAPDGFECVWQKQIPILSTSDGNHRKAVEKLYKSPCV